jgi:hypothetical protein
VAWLPLGQDLEVDRQDWTTIDMISLCLCLGVVKNISLLLDFGQLSFSNFDSTLISTVVR